MKHTTVAFTQSIIGLILIITMASLQAVALSELNKGTVDNADIKSAKKTLLISVIIQFVAALLFAISFIMLWRTVSSGSQSSVIYGALLVSGSLMVTGGALGSSAALRLQCHKSDANVKKAWKFSTYSAIIGILGSIFLLIIQTFARKEQIAQATHRFLDKRMVSQQQRAAALKQQALAQAQALPQQQIIVPQQRAGMYSYAEDF